MNLNDSKTTHWNNWRTTGLTDRDILGDGDRDRNLFNRPDDRVMRRVTVNRCDAFLADASRRALAALRAAVL